MKRLGFTVAKNALANVVRGGASAIVAVALPHFLTHDLSIDRFAAWVLMLQIAAYSNYLDFGVQTAVARYVAQAMERRNEQQRDEVISTAFGLLLLAAALALLISLLIVWQLPHLFHSAPLQLIGELRGGILVLSVSAAALLPLSTFSGILIGLHRNEYPALAIGSTRLAGAAAVLIVVRFTPSLVALALCIAFFNLLGGVLQYRFSRRLLPNMRMGLDRVTRRMTRELVSYCTGLTAFSFGMLLVTGLDLTIVGYFSFGDTGYYAIASTIIAMIVGFSGSIYAAFMAPLAVLQERREHARIRSLVLTGTRLGSYASLVLVLLMVLWGKPLLTLWVGPQYASKALPLLEILLWAQTIRLTASAYSVALIATAQQNYGIAGALTEGFTNLIASVIGARLIGPAGVAWGTFAGAICGVLWLVLYVMRRVQEIPIDWIAFTREAMLRPVFCLLPCLLYVYVYGLSNPHSYSSIKDVIMPGLAILMSAFLLLRFGEIPRLHSSRSLPCT